MRLHNFWDKLDPNLPYAPKRNFFEKLHQDLFDVARILGFGSANVTTSIHIYMHVYLHSQQAHKNKLKCLST